MNTQDELPPENAAEAEQVASAGCAPTHGSAGEEYPHNAPPKGLDGKIKELEKAVGHLFLRGISDAIDVVADKIRIKASGEFRPGIHLTAELYDPAFERWSEELTEVSLADAIKRDLENAAWHGLPLPSYYFDDILEALDETRKEVEGFRHEYEQNDQVL